MKTNMKRMILITALCMMGSASVLGESAEVTSGVLPFDGMMFYPDGTLTFNGGNAVLTNLPGFYERSGIVVENSWASNLTLPLTFNGLKPTAEMLDMPLGAFPAMLQYSYTGIWHVPATGAYSFAGGFDDGVYLEIDGQPILNTQASAGRAFTNGVQMTQGWHTLHVRCVNIGGNGGKPADWASGVIFSPDNLDFSDSANIAHGQAFGAGNDVIAILDTLDTPSRIYGRMLMSQNGTITVSQHPAVVNDPVFCGTVQSPANETLTFVGLNGPSLLFGSPDPAAPAILDGNVANALTLTNHAWLCRLSGAGGYTVAQGATLAFDGIANPDVSGGSLTLDTYSLQMLATTPGISTVTVNDGTTLSFDPRTYADGIFTDAPAAFSTDITLDGGSVLFNASQPMLFDGTFAGTGDIAKNGAGTLTLAGTGSGCAATFTLNDGTVALSNAAALCGAPVLLAGGRLSNLTSMTLANPVTAQAGGIETPAGTVLDITSAVTGPGGISKWGAGTLTLSGSADNAGLTLDVLDGTVALNKTGARALYGIDGIAAGATVTVTGATGDQIADSGHVRLSGGTLDLNGHDETVGYIATSSYESAIINNGPQAATLTLAAADTVAAVYENGVMADGSSPLSVVKTGTGTQTVKAGALQYSGATTVNGGTLRLLPVGHNSASLFRLTLKAARSVPPGQSAPPLDYYNSGIQFSEFQLTYKKEGLTWPSGMDAQGAGGNGNEVASRVVDNNTGSKWYFNQSIPLPNELIVASPVPMIFDGYRLATRPGATLRHGRWKSASLTA